MGSHSEYDQQRASQKLEQQRQDALREAARRAKTPEQAKRDQAALNEFYNRRSNAMPGSAGHKVKPCAVLLVAGGGGISALVWALAEAAGRIV